MYCVSYHTIFHGEVAMRDQRLQAVWYGTIEKMVFHEA